MSNQPPYGAPNQYGMPQPPGQQPKKSNTGLIAAIAALVIAVVAVTVALVVVLNKDDDSDSSSDPSSSSPSSDSTSSSSDASSQSSDPTSDTPDPSGEQVQGTGYTYQLPEGWSLDDALASSSGFDSVAVSSGASAGEKTNVIVQRGEATDATDLEASRDAWEEQLSSEPRDSTPLPNRTIGGYDAIGVRMDSTTDKGTDVTSLAYLVVADGHPYTIVLTSAVTDGPEAKRALDDILASWTFD